MRMRKEKMCSAELEMRGAPADFVLLRNIAVDGFHYAGMLLEGVFE